MILDTMHGYIEEDERRMDRTIVQHTYRGHADRFRAQLTGQTEMAVVLAIFMPVEIWRDQDPVPEADLVKWLPAAPAAVDYRHVWRQDQRSIGHYDGSTAGPPIRNIAAAVGATGVAEFVHARNALDATVFLRGLPAPAYPFPVDASLAIQGKEIFDQACLSCHFDGEKLIELDTIGTDPNRALAITEAGRITFIQAIRTACGDEPECDLPDERIVKTPDAPKGYLAAPLSGTWATAPYLHNGSVPTMHHLLVPESRPAQFRRGREDYDTVNMGFGWDGEAGAPWDTTLPGRSNIGHADPDIFFGGIDFSEDEASRLALMEYLKTL